MRSKLLYQSFVALAVLFFSAVTDVYDNYFFMNKCDLQLPSVSVGVLEIKANRFEEVEQFKRYENNRELTDKSFLSKIDQAYLEAFSKLKVMSSTSYDPNSAANQYREAHGLNKQGTEIIRPSMFANRYNLNKALQLWGAMADYGAQKPR